jgi:hypothetical protein
LAANFASQKIQKPKQKINLKNLNKISKLQAPIIITWGNQFHSNRSNPNPK